MFLLVAIPLFAAPQQSQVIIVLSLPVEQSRRLPQSLQKMRVPMADMVNVGVTKILYCSRIFKRQGGCWRKADRGSRLQYCKVNLATFCDLKCKMRQLKEDYQAVYIKLLSLCKFVGTN